MSSRKRPKARYTTEDTLTAEFTTGQLVIGICVALAFALVMFGMGIALGKTQRYPDDVEVQSAGQESSAEETPQTEPERHPARSSKKPTETVKAARNTGSGEQTSPRIPVRKKPAEATSAAKETRSEEPAPEAARRERAENESRPRITELPPLPNRPADNSSGVREEMTVEPLPAAKEENPPAVVTLPARESKPESSKEETRVAEADKPTEPVKKPAEPKPAEVKPVPPKAPPTTSSTAAWGIQVGAFLGEARSVKARDYMRRLEATMKVNAEVYPSEDDSIYRVFVVGYADKAAASAACAELRKKAGFADAVPKAIP